MCVPSNCLFHKCVCIKRMSSNSLIHKCVCKVCESGQIVLYFTGVCVCVWTHVAIHLLNWFQALLSVVLPSSECLSKKMCVCLCVCEAVTQIFTFTMFTPLLALVTSSDTRVSASDPVIYIHHDPHHQWCIWEVAIAQWLECQICDQKVLGSSLQQENFFLQGPFSVLTLILVSVPPSC